MMRLYLSVIFHLLALLAANVPAAPAPTCLDNHNVPYAVSSSPNWTALSSTYNLRLPYSPAVITLPNTAEDVTNSILCAVQAGLTVQAKGGGHSYASYSTGGKNGSLIIEMQNFNSITVDQSKPPLLLNKSQSNNFSYLHCKSWRWTTAGKHCSSNLPTRSTSSPPWDLPWSWNRRPCFTWRLWLCLSKMGVDLGPHRSS
jgi:hypothetical protein